MLPPVVLCHLTALWPNNSAVIYREPLFKNKMGWFKANTFFLLIPFADLSTAYISQMVQNINRIIKHR
jgi:hypothetical protein